jgi:hypothetical protein
MVWHADFCFLSRFLFLCSTPLARSFEYDASTVTCAVTFVCEACSFSSLRPSLDVRLPRATARAAAIALQVSVPHYTAGETFSATAVFTPLAGHVFQCSSTQASLTLTTSLFVAGEDVKDPRNPSGLIAELSAITPGDSVTDVTSAQCRGSGGSSGVGLSVALQQNQVWRLAAVAAAFLAECCLLPRSHSRRSPTSCASRPARRRSTSSRKSRHC